jgi:hypothetical protein
MDADNDRFRFRRVDQRAEGVEDGREAELFPDGGDADHGGMVQRREEEEERGLGGDVREGGGREGRDGAAERQEDVGRTGRGRRCLVAMLQSREREHPVRLDDELRGTTTGRNEDHTHLVDAESCSGGDDGSGGADVERVVAVAACPDNVADGPVSMLLDVDFAGMVLHDLGALCDNLGLTVLAGQAEGCEKGADLGRVGAVMLCEVVEGEAGVGEREGGRVGDEFLEERRERLGRVDVAFWLVHNRVRVAAGLRVSFRERCQKRCRRERGGRTDPIIWMTEGSESAVPLLCESMAVRAESVQSQIRCRPSRRRSKFRNPLFT